ncbi:hypothetical protein AB0C74_24670 [Spirillospora sp. NPDC048832]
MRDRVCDYAGNFDLLPVSESHLPLSTKCPRGNAVVEIVLAWINPALLGIFLASMALAVAAQRFASGSGSTGLGSGHRRGREDPAPSVIDGFHGV